jgi:hypothetical protein
VTEHVDHPANEDGWRPAGKALSQEQWDSIMALLDRTPVGERPKIVEPRPAPSKPYWFRRGGGFMFPADEEIRFEPYVRQYPAQYDHWAFMDPETGEVLDTAATEALLRDILEGGPKSQAWWARLREILERYGEQDRSDD